MIGNMKKKNNYMLNGLDMKVSLLLKAGAFMGVLRNGCRAAQSWHTDSSNMDYGRVVCHSALIASVAVMIAAVLTWLPVWLACCLQIELRSFSNPKVTQSCIFMAR